MHAVLVNISKVQDDEVGDGTTSVCVLAAEMREAEETHPYPSLKPRRSDWRRASHNALKHLPTQQVIYLQLLF
jgi:T-complex protein 1 subunit beta